MKKLELAAKIKTIQSKHRLQILQIWRCFAFFKCLLLLISIIKSMEREKPPKGSNKKTKHYPSESDEEDSYMSDEEYQSSFVVNDSSVSEEEGAYHYRPKVYDEPQQFGNKEKQKKDKYKGKKKKQRRKKENDQSFDEDDLDLIDEAKNLVRLKKNWEQRESQGEEDLQENSDENQSVHSILDFQAFNALPMNARICGRGPLFKSRKKQMSQDDSEQEEEEPKFIEVIEKQIINPFDANITLTQDYKEITQTDLPQRYIYLLKKHIRGDKKDYRQVMQQIDLSNLFVEGNWIFNRLKQEGNLLMQSYDEKLYKKNIVSVIQCFHKEHLDPMYIFYYRKMLFKDYVNLQLLWKIIELDDEWHHFKQRKDKVVKFVQTVLPSYTQVPNQLTKMVKQLTAPNQLKYFQDFQRFTTTRFAINTLFTKEQGNGQNDELEKKKKKIKANKLGFITQMAQRGIIDQIQSNHIVLKPQQFCYNIKKKQQQKKPRSPQNQPKDEFQTYFATSNPQSDKIKYPLLVGENRYKTIIKYLTFELFSYPQLKKIIKNLYYKNLVLTTIPTIRGNQDIDLYSIFFPVKKIREKPVSTLKRQVWILAREAQKQGLIQIDLRFFWQTYVSERNEKASDIDKDVVFSELSKQYYDLIPSKNAEIWNIFRKRILNNLLYDLFIPSFLQEIRLDLNRQGQQEIIKACCTRLKSQLNKAPALKEGVPVKILALVVEETKLGGAFVDEAGKVLHTFVANIFNEFQIKNFVNEEELKQRIKQYKPDLILIAANCKKAQILKRQMRAQNFQSQSIPCTFGEYQIPRLIAKKRRMEGLPEEQIIIEAISMARLKKNPMAEIVTLWDQRISQNGILSMNLHPYQKFVNQLVLKQSLEKVIIEIVNLVGLDINQIQKYEHLQSQVQFISGLGHKKAKYFLEKLKEKKGQVLSRQKIQQLIKGSVVHRNCSPFLKVQTSLHRNLFQPLDKNKKGDIIYALQSINLLDMTRITIQWYDDINTRLRENIKYANLSEIRTRKQFSKLSQENIFLLEMFKNPEKISKISNWVASNDICYDQQFIVSSIKDRFKDPREKPKEMDNRQIFFNLLRETPESLKRYMILPVKVLGVKRNCLSVIDSQSGLFGYIKLQPNKSAEQYEKIYEKGTMIKAILTGFPFDEKNKSFKDQGSVQQNDFLKIEMSLDFPHKESDPNEHKCMKLCYPLIIKQLHPLIDLEKGRFSLRRDDLPIMQKKDEKITEQKVQPRKQIAKKQYRSVSHPKFKNISIQQAIQLMKTAEDGDFVIRPSSQGYDYLTITWKFLGTIIVHIKIRCEQKNQNNLNLTYRIEDRENITYNNLEQIIEKCIKPMNLLVQDVTHNRKFLNRSISEIESIIKEDMTANKSRISYYFGASEDFPQYFLLIYEYKGKKICKELIKVKSSGLVFHNQHFSTSNDLVIWFKEHLKEKDYQKHVKNILPLQRKK